MPHPLDHHIDHLSNITSSGVAMSCVSSRRAPKLVGAEVKQSDDLGGCSLLALEPAERSPDMRVSASMQAAAPKKCCAPAGQIRLAALDLFAGMVPRRSGHRRRACIGTPFFGGLGRARTRHPTGTMHVQHWLRIRAAIQAPLFNRRSNAMHKDRRTFLHVFASLLQQMRGEAPAWPASRRT